MPSRVHAKVPGHNWMKMNALLEITDRAWCVYVCWTPEGVSMFDVRRDTSTFNFLLKYYKAVHESLALGEENIAPLLAYERQRIAARVESAMLQTVSPRV